MDDLNQNPYLRLIQNCGLTRHPGGIYLTDILLKKANVKKNSRVLDVGCGAGHSSAYIAKNYGCKVVGVDISEHAIENAKTFYGNEPFFERMSFKVAEARDLSAIRGKFDVVLCESVLLFIEDKDQALQEMSCHVKDHGFLALNELCVKEGDDTKKITEFWGEPEFGGHVTNSSDIVGWFNKKQWDLLLLDEQPVDMKAQFMAELAQWGNFKGGMQLLEAGFQLLTSKQLHKDLFKVAKKALTMPESIFKYAFVLLLLAQKK